MPEIKTSLWSLAFSIGCLNSSVSALVQIIHAWLIPNHKLWSIIFIAERIFQAPSWSSLSSVCQYDLVCTFLVRTGKWVLFRDTMRFVVGNMLVPFWNMIYMTLQIMVQKLYMLYICSLSNQKRTDSIVLTDWI